MQPISKKSSSMTIMSISNTFNSIYRKWCAPPRGTHKILKHITKRLFKDWNESDSELVKTFKPLTKCFSRHWREEHIKGNMHIYMFMILLYLPCLIKICDILSSNNKALSEITPSLTSFQGSSKKIELCCWSPWVWASHEKLLPARVTTLYLSLNCQL